MFLWHQIVYSWCLLSKTEIILNVRNLRDDYFNLQPHFTVPVHSPACIISVLYFSMIWWISSSHQCNFVDVLVIHLCLPLTSVGVCVGVGGAVSSPGGVRSVVLLHRHHHRPQPDLRRHHRHVCRPEEWETEEGGDSEDHLLHLWWAETKWAAGQQDSEVKTSPDLQLCVFQVWRETSSTTRRCRLRSTSNWSTTSGTTCTSSSWCARRTRRTTPAPRATSLTWSRWEASADTGRLK